MPSGPLRITGGPALDPELFKSDKKNRRQRNPRPLITTNQAHEKAKQQEEESCWCWRGRAAFSRAHGSEWWRLWRLRVSSLIIIAREPTPRVREREKAHSEI